ncbi:MAG: pantoate--beta-alanine ligase [Bacteroidales bacterium]
MIVYRTKQDLIQHIKTWKDQGKTIGLVPTMGALHEGHASLVHKAGGENDVVVVSIFVNPTQFNDPSDLEHYPRRLEEDLELLQSMKVSIVFTPTVREMYPEEDHRTFDLGGLDQVLEGTFRKGHFTGVAQIVSKLFELIEPTRAYFGQKDFQQLVIVKRLVELLQMKIEIVPCPIVREKDGLALSSRNALLSEEDRKAAPFIYQTLRLAREKKGTMTPEEVRAWISSRFQNQSLMRLEYFDIVEDKGLSPVMDWSEPVNKVGCIAVQLGRVRLIDNLNFN